MSFLTSIINEYISVILGTGVAGGVLASMTPEILFLSKFRKMTSFLEKNGEEKQIDHATQDLIYKVLNKILLPANDEAAINFYVTAVSDPLFYGSSKLRTGALVGLPVSFQNDRNTDLSKESFSFAGIRLVYDETSNSEASKLLADSFILSQKAKSFVIARETFYASSYRLHMETALRTIIASGLVVGWNAFHSNTTLAKRLKPWAKLIFFGGMSFAWGMLYFFLKDAHRCWLDYAVDKKTARLGKEFAQGGVEYYESLLKRNKAIRLLLPDGKSQFTQFGNDVSTFRQKTLQKTTRRDILVRMLEEYEATGEGAEAVPPPPQPTDIARPEKS